MKTTGIVDQSAQYAEPRLVRLGRHREVALIEFAGDLDAAAYQTLANICDGLARDKQPGEAPLTVVLRIDTKAADWPSREAHAASEALLALRKAVPVFAFVENAVGAGYLLAAYCSSIISMPCARIGQFRACDDGATALFEVMVTDARPLAGVKEDALASLADEAVHGEQAESLRLVDGLEFTIERLIAKVFGKARVAILEG